MNNKNSIVSYMLRAYGILLHMYMQLYTKHTVVAWLLNTGSLHVQCMCKHGITFFTQVYGLI